MSNVKDNDEAEAACGQTEMIRPGSCEGCAASNQERKVMSTAKRLMILWGIGALAFTGCSTDETQGPNLQPKTPTASQLTFNDDVFEANPIFSPDGQWILFESDLSGNMDIWRIPAGGGTAVQLTTDVSFDSSPYWAPDGNSIVFESDRSGHKNIWILAMNVANAEPEALTAGEWDDGSPAWSPEIGRAHV